MKKIAILLTSCLLALCASDDAMANKKAKPVRWFEVEVILFTREIPHDSIREAFEQQVEPIKYKRNRDLLTKFHYPDIKNLFYQLGGCSIEDSMHYELERKYNALPSVTELTMQFEDDPLATSMVEPVGDDFNHPIDIEWFYQSFTPTDVTQIAKSEPNTCGETIDFTNWYKGLDYVAKRRHHLRSFEYHYDMYPRVIIAGERRHNNYVHLMSPANFKLREIYRTLRRQPDIRPILHTSWRQPGYSSGRSRATRLYAGYDFSERFDFQGNLKPPEYALTNLIDQSAPILANQNNSTVASLSTNKQSVVDNIEKVLAQINQGATIDYQNHFVKQSPAQIAQNKAPLTPEQVREIDGLFRIYIDNFNYLHIDAEFNVRKEIDLFPDAIDKGFASLTASTNTITANIDDGQSEQANKTRLVNYHFKQTRRVISKQLHYFDHPYMGMIVQIRRHGW